ncbi:MAG: hypothetical protein ABSD71_09780 [Bacteroidales bacterium]|jgi:hypothetical protein
MFIRETSTGVHTRDFRNEFHRRSDYFFDADPMNLDAVTTTVKMSRI